MYRMEGCVSQVCDADFKYLTRLCDRGLLREAFTALQLVNCRIPDIVWGCFLQKCSDEKDLQMGRKAYAVIGVKGLEYNVYVGSYLIRMFDECGSLTEATDVFGKLKKHNCYTWSAIISANINHGKADESIELYFKMQHSGRTPDGHTFVAVLKACIICNDLRLGMMIHRHIVETGLKDDIIDNTLIDMYAMFGDVIDGRNLFNKISKHDKVTWNSMIKGYAQNGFGLDALCLFWEMLHQTVQPDKFTLVSTLKACSTEQSFHQGKYIHIIALETGISSNMHISSALIDMYCNCCRVSHARRVFDSLPMKNLVIWNAMITGYVEQGCNNEALEIYENLLDDSGESPDHITFLGVLKASSNFSNLYHGKSVHIKIINYGFELDTFIGNTLIDMYAKCGKLHEAWCVFENHSVRDLVTWNAIISSYSKHGHFKVAVCIFMQMKQAGIMPDIVTWNALIAGFAQHGHGEDALEVFSLMQKDGIKPDNLTFASILKACSSMTALDQGRIIHSYIIGEDQVDEFVECAVIDMYTKCGDHEDAQMAFRNLSKPDVVTWNAMLTGYALHNEYMLALNCVDEMQQQGLKPDDVTSTNILSMCSRMGLREAACQHIQSTTLDCGFLPAVRHYSCIIDILSRTGCLNEAVDVLKAMPFSYNILHWTSLLTSCRTYGNVKLGKRCFSEVLVVDENYGSAYVMLSNIYADAYIEVT